MRERCEVCDRADCEWFAENGQDVAARFECRSRAVDWRARALTAEALLRRARLYVAAYWNSDAPIDKRDAAGDVYRAIVSLIDPKDAALCLPGAGEDKKR